MRNRVLTAIRLALATLLLTGVIYPLAVTGIATVLFPARARGSLVTGADGSTVGSSLIGQSFAGERYFHPRPSVTAYDGRVSGGSNLGPTSAVLASKAGDRAFDVRRTEGLDASDTVPVDLVTASASGLDPHVTPAAARVQAPRVARARGMEVAQVLSLIDAETEQPLLGIIGESRVNVLLLNMELDRAEAR